MSANHPEFYTEEDFQKVKKIDAHIHLSEPVGAMSNLAKDQNFQLITINVDFTDTLSDIISQEEIAQRDMEKNPGVVHYMGTFTVENYDEDNWSNEVINRIEEVRNKGAVAIKIWKNIGMSLKNKQGEFVMVDDAKLQPVLKYLSDNNFPLAAHIGEPKNCWLPVEEMTVINDQEYFSKNPEYHMYLHPEMPSYERLLQSRDYVLETYPNLRFISLHLGSMEWSIDEIAKRMEKYPNFVVDIAARIYHLQHQCKSNWEEVRNFMIKYQDRIIYGSDIIQDDIKKEELPAFVSRIWKEDWLFLTSDKKLTSSYLEGAFKGLHLPRNVVDKIYYDNAVRYYGLN